MVRAEIAACVATASSVARQADAAVATGSGMTAGLASASQAAHEAVASFENAYFKQRKFEPYLHFASEEDERRYREREAEREKQINEASARGTPEGNKKAIDLSIDQMRDAGAHGAAKSPDFEPTYDTLLNAGDDLTAQLGAQKEKQKSTSAQPASDPLDTPSAPVATVPSNILAKFKASGITMPDQSGTGHGVDIDVSPQQTARLHS